MVKENKNNASRWKPFPKRLRDLIGTERGAAAKLAKTIGVTPQTISAYINGQIALPDMDTAIKIANYFQVSLDTLFRDNHDGVPNETDIILMAAEYTGLTSAAIEVLHEYANPDDAAMSVPQDLCRYRYGRVISDMLEQDYFISRGYHKDDKSLSVDISYPDINEDQMPEVLRYITNFLFFSKGDEYTLIGENLQPIGTAKAGDNIYIATRDNEMIPMKANIEEAWINLIRDQLKEFKKISALDANEAAEDARRRYAAMVAELEE